MQANPQFSHFDKRFWAHVRAVGQAVGYTQAGQVRTYTRDDIQKALNKAGLQLSSTLADSLMGYFDFRAGVLNTYVEPRLMDAARAEAVFNEYRERLQPTCPLPMNKQRGDKKRPAYLTGLVNMLIEAHAKGYPCDYDPRKMTAFTGQHVLVRTLARRMDGCFPTCTNPVAVWEIKEYYYTTTFGSRIAGAVYETLLDGLELEEMAVNEGIEVQHLLMIDAYGTWWEMGKSYLCRLVDLLHMGYVDEILFGYEVVERLPGIVAGWVDHAEARQ